MIWGNARTEDLQLFRLIYYSMGQLYGAKLGQKCLEIDNQEHNSTYICYKHTYGPKGYLHCFTD